MVMMPMPVEPPASRWAFPALNAYGDDLIGFGADLAPGTLLSAYRSGLFPMPTHEALGWWSPDPRGILAPGDLRISRSLRRSCRRYRVTCNTDFRAVITACWQTKREGGWLNQDFVEAYCVLHDLGWTHSIEVWDANSTLVGGLYGVHINGLFAGESMFSTATDTSKVALVSLIDRLEAADVSLLDVQWRTDHLATLGITAIPRITYLSLLETALAQPHKMLC